MDFTLPEPIELLRRTVRNHAPTRLQPLEDQIDRLYPELPLRPPLPRHARC